MKNQIGGDFEAAIAPLREEIEDWRSVKNPRGRIPDSIWEGAQVLAATYGINPVVRSLRLGYKNLQDRMTKSTRQVVSAGFVEARMVLPPRPKSAIEITQETEGRFQIKITGISSPGMADLVAQLSRYL